MFKNKQVYNFLAYTILASLLCYLIAVNIGELGWEIFYWISAAFGILCVFFAARKNILTYYFGVFAVVTYGIVSLHSNYIYDYMLNIFFLLPIQVIGYAMWKQHMKDESHVMVAKLKHALPIALVTVTAIVLLSTVLYDPFAEFVLKQPSSITGVYRLLDASTTVLTILAQILMIKRYSLQWPIWIAINIMAIFMWLDLSSPAQVVMWSFYLLNSFYGYYVWRKG